jgi:arginine deiminase
VRGGNELDESDVEELGDEDHDREDKDGGEELDEVVAMTSTVDRDELNEGRGRAHGMTMVIRRGRS